MATALRYSEETKPAGAAGGDRPRAACMWLEPPFADPTAFPQTDTTSAAFANDARPPEQGAGLTRSTSHPREPLAACEYPRGMPFPREVREDALVRSGRCCCVCHMHAGRDAEVHHISQEADGGANTIANAIVLCSKCHGEAGHYNPRHPKGSKYSPGELRRHRDEWWAYRESNYRPAQKPSGYEEPLGSGRDVPLQRCEVGVLWSCRADISASKEIIEFHARHLGDERLEDLSKVRLASLYLRPDGTFLVYVCMNHRSDWCEAWLDGVPPESGPLTLDELHVRYPALATAAGLQRTRRL